ncbi:ABC transporter permease [Halobacillus shinanisalinarum]|uniref:ABC transporter permease n=1 Tax=Halobacillus shinanisalinarum TaxID=2932258 RepID=A0ABY4H585_9BACI|nr:ABC transporter permease [Halobacillus shinanisalinarum]UOQ94742.1 ABC transporter permease [Halobacillus shinanisalinarum]
MKITNLLKERTGLRLLSMNLRQRTLLFIAIAVFILTAIVVGGALMGEGQLATNFSIKNNPPSLGNFFGTDWMGRDMLARTLKGLTLSFGVGMLAASLSVLVALTLSLLASTSRLADLFVTWLIDLFLSIPHLVSLILIAFTLGGGFKGVVVGIALTHWPSLARVLRAEVLQLRNAEYVQVSRRFGKSPWWIAYHHVFPHLLPQLLVGFTLLFPHAILHEAAVTFLGFGLSPQQPAIGIILSESMAYLSTGMWWLAFFPGLSLIIMVRAFDILGDQIRKLIDPNHAHE